MEALKAVTGGNMCRGASSIIKSNFEHGRVWVQGLHLENLFHRLCLLLLGST